MKLTPKDESHLKKVYPDLARVIRRAATMWPHKDQEFFITCSLRTLEEQKKLFAAGATRTMNSRHLPHKTDKLSRAVDLAVKVNGEIRWDWPLFAQMSKTVKEAAKAEKVPITWGGDWVSFKDGPHFELTKKSYP